MKLRAPQDCHSMNDLRSEIDALDTALVGLLATRSRYIDRAIELKRIVGLPARIPDRVQEVVTGVRATAANHDLDADLVERLWHILIEWSIERESRSLDG